ncbi:MAG: type II toxin-antitoxin system VapC family toxin [Candidatus Limnocylindrales bacterium]
MTPVELASQHRRIGLDANVLIYLFEDDGLRRAKAAGLLDAVEAGSIQGFLATIGLSEILIGPARRGDLAGMEHGADLIRSLPGLTLVPLTAEIAIDAAVIRGARAVTLDDAVHLASARAAGATAFVTNDRRLRGAPHLEVVYLDDLDAAEEAVPEP